MLPLLAMSGEGLTGARTAPLKMTPAVPAPVRTLQVESRFLPAPNGFKLGGVHFVRSQSDVLEDAAEILLKQNHSSAITEKSFVYVYIAENKLSAVVLAIHETMVYSITHADLNGDDEFYGLSDVLDSVPLRRTREKDGADHTARIEELRASIEELRVELEREEAASQRLLAEKASLPRFVTTDDGDAARFRREAEPPRVIDPLIQKPQQRRAARPKKPVPAPPSPGSSEPTEPTEPLVPEPLIAELSDDD